MMMMMMRRRRSRRRRMTTKVIVSIRLINHLPDILFTPMLLVKLQCWLLTGQNISLCWWVFTASFLPWITLRLWIIEATLKLKMTCSQTEASKLVSFSMGYLFLAPGYLQVGAQGKAPRNRQWGGDPSSVPACVAGGGATYGTERDFDWLLIRGFP